MDLNILLLSAIVFLPAVGALLIAFAPKDQVNAIRAVTLIVTLLVLGLSLGLALYSFDKTGESAAWMQDTFNVSWIPSFDIYYYMGVDGISLPLVVLTALVSVLAMGASWSIKKHVKAYCILFLLLETGMLGVFLALDFFLFYVFWEVMLLPMYFLIGVWGGPRREYAAIKFFLYTLAGSVLMLIAILMLYFHSDLRQVVKASDYLLEASAGEANIAWRELKINPNDENSLVRLASPSGDQTAQIALLPLATVKTDSGRARPLQVDFEAAGTTSASYDDVSNIVTVGIAEAALIGDLVAAIRANEELKRVLRAAVPAGGNPNASALPSEPTTFDFEYQYEPIHSFNLLALAAMGQHTNCFPGWLQVTAFVLLFIGFAIKVPSVPFHTWLPDAHVEAPTPISMILAGVLLKMGGYGIIRICYPICPLGGWDLRYVVCAIGVISMVYGAFAAMAQKDFKRLVAYSSVSHMGYVVLGLGVWSATALNPNGAYNADMWQMGITGAMFQMIGHGISSAGMFFMVGVVYDRVHHRNLNEFGGLFGKMPVYTALSIGIFFAGLGLPGLCGFIGEVFVVLSVWSFSKVLAVISAGVVILTAAYILWAIQRVYLGSEYKGPHEEDLKEINGRELSIAVPLFVLAILLGVFPYQTVIDFMDETIERQANDLADWRHREDENEKAAEALVEDRDAADENAGAAILAPHSEPVTQSTPPVMVETEQVVTVTDAVTRGPIRWSSAKLKHKRKG